MTAFMTSYSELNLGALDSLSSNKNTEREITNHWLKVDGFCTTLKRLHWTDMGEEIGCSCVLRKSTLINILGLHEAIEIDFLLTYLFFSISLWVDLWRERKTWAAKHKRVPLFVWNYCSLTACCGGVRKKASEKRLRGRLWQSEWAGVSFKENAQKEFSKVGSSFCGGNADFL